MQAGSKKLMSLMQGLLGKIVDEKDENGKDSEGSMNIGYGKPNKQIIKKHNPRQGYTKPKKALNL